MSVTVSDQINMRNKSPGCWEQNNLKIERQLTHIQNIIWQEFWSQQIIFAQRLIIRNKFSDWLGNVLRVFH